MPHPPKQRDQGRDHVAAPKQEHAMPFPDPSRKREGDEVG